VNRQERADPEDAQYQQDVLGSCAQQKRQEWIAALDKMESLRHLEV
jgi:hypothetical protein